MSASAIRMLDCAGVEEEDSWYLAKTLGDESTLVFLGFSVLVHLPLEDKSCAEYGPVLRSVDGHLDPTRELSFHLWPKRSAPLRPFRIFLDFF